MCRLLVVCSTWTFVKSNHNKCIIIHMCIINTSADKILPLYYWNILLTDIECKIICYNYNLLYLNWCIKIFNFQLSKVIYCALNRCANSHMNASFTQYYYAYVMGMSQIVYQSHGAKSIINECVDNVMCLGTFGHSVFTLRPSRHTSATAWTSGKGSGNIDQSMALFIHYK